MHEEDNHGAAPATSTRAISRSVPSKVLYIVQQEQTLYSIFPSHRLAEKATYLFSMHLLLISKMGRFTKLCIQPSHTIKLDSSHMTRPRRPWNHLVRP